MKRSLILAIVLGCAAVAGFSDSALAQEDRPDYQNVNQNAHADRVAARSPGRLVAAGIARSREFMNNAFDGTNIDRPASDVQLSPWAQARIESLQILFTNINLMINAFHNTIRAQAGLAPVPPVLPNFSSGGGTDGGLDSGNIGDLIDDFLNR